MDSNGNSTATQVVATVGSIGTAALLFHYGYKKTALAVMFAPLILLAGIALYVGATKLDPPGPSERGAAINGFPA